MRIALIPMLLLVGLTGCNSNGSRADESVLPAMEWVRGGEVGDIVRPGASTGASARCRRGQQPISGSWRYRTVHLTEVLVETSRPVDGGWNVALRNQSGANIEIKLEVLVLCVSGAPKPPPF